MGRHLVFLVLLAWCFVHGVDGQVSCTDRDLPGEPVDVDAFGGTWRRPPGGTASKNSVHLGQTQPGTEENDWGCTCVPSNACHTRERTHLGDEDCDYHGGAHVIDIRTYRPAEPTTACADAQHVCCPFEHVAGNRSAGCPEPGCGHRYPDGVGFCVPGEFHGDAAFGEFPWMAAVAVERLGGVRFQCGASLINRRAVLTAAHCVFGLHAHDLVVRVGEWDARSTAEPNPHQDLLVANIIVHPKFTTDTLYNDIALLILATPARHDEHVASVCLPQAGASFDKSRCFVTGWGQDVEDRHGTFHSVLKKRDVPIVPRSKCQAALRRTKLGEHFKLHESFLCAGGERGWDACTGDGGGPLVCPLLEDPSKWQQAGVVAWGIGCGEDQTPGVYVDVAQFRPWIDRKLAEEKINSFSYTP